MITDDKEDLRYDEIKNTFIFVGVPFTACFEVNKT
jgi:hypothetical protein